MILAVLKLLDLGAPLPLPPEQLQHWSSRLPRLLSSCFLFWADSLAFVFLIHSTHHFSLNLRLRGPAFWEADMGDFSVTVCSFVLSYGSFSLFFVLTLQYFLQNFSASSFDLVNVAFS